MKIKSYICIIITVFPFVCFAQTKDLKRADDAYKEKTYSLAIEYYCNALDDAREKKNTDVMGYAAFKVAECYYQSNNYERAIPFYRTAVENNYKDTSKILYSHYGDMLMMIGEYQQAREMYQKQISQSGSNMILASHIAACDFVDTAKTHETLYEVSNVQSINSRYGDFSPSKWRNKIVFTTTRFSSDSIVYTYTGDGFEDLFETFYNEEQDSWSPVERLKGTINSSYNDGTFAFDAKNNTAYFMQCNGSSGADKNCNIYLSKYNEDKALWEKPKAFQYYTTAYSSGHPAITPDGLTLYFVSNNPAGHGGTDIWKCHRDSANTDKWSEPINLGSNINTAQNEMFPYAPNNDGLYFSSNGHPGYGGLDMFYSPKVSSGYGTPINLRPPFNSSADDFSLMYISDNSGLFTSNRIGGVGNDDIYKFGLKVVKIEAAGRVIDKTNMKPLDNTIVIIKNVTNEIVDTLLTDSVGMYYYPAMDPNMQYKIFVYKNGFLNPDGKQINTTGVTQYTYMDSIHGYDMNFVLEKIEKNKEYEIRDIYYDLDKYELRPASVVELEKLVAILNNNPDICIQINSHTDERASDDYNKILSNNRAKAVVDYLNSQGIDMKRLTWRGWGETNPIFKKAKTEEQHQANRRTTFSIVNFEELELSKKDEEHQNTVAKLQSAGKQEPKGKGVYFRLQIAASKAKNNTIFRKLNATYPDLPTYCSKDSDGLYKYTVGSYTNFQEASKMKDSIDALGYHSFVVAYEDGKKVSINEALRKMQNDKPSKKK